MNWLSSAGYPWIGLLTQGEQGLGQVTIVDAGRTDAKAYNYPIRVTASSSRNPSHQPSRLLQPMSAISVNQSAPRSLTTRTRLGWKRSDREKAAWSERLNAAKLAMGDDSVCTIGSAEQSDKEMMRRVARSSSSTLDIR